LKEQKKTLNGQQLSEDKLHVFFFFFFQIKKLICYFILKDGRCLGKSGGTPTRRCLEDQNNPLLGVFGEIMNPCVLCILFIFYFFSELFYLHQFDFEVRI